MSGRDRGSASVLLLAVGLVVLLAGGAGAGLGAAHVARHQAQAAADFGALAGAIRLVEGPAAACARAAVLVEANQGRLVGCEADGPDLIVAVEVTPAAGVGLGRSATASARAGPLRGAAGPPRPGRPWLTTSPWARSGRR